MQGQLAEYDWLQRHAVSKKGLFQYRGQGWPDLFGFTWLKEVLRLDFS